MKKFYANTHGFIPIRIMISLAVIAVISSLFAIGWYQFSIIHAEDQIESCCNSLISKLYSQLASGVPRDINGINEAEGTIRALQYTLPSSLQYIGFGCDPDYNNDGLLEETLTLNGSIICFKIYGGNKQYIRLDEEKIRFREGVYKDNTWNIHTTLDHPYGVGFILNEGGKITLTFELVQNQTERFILIQANDNIY